MDRALQSGSGRGRRDFHGGRGRGGRGGRRPYDGGGGGNRPDKRAKTMEMSAEEVNVRRLRQYIITNDGMEDHLTQLTDVLKHEISQYGTQICSTILECAAEMPLKTGTYSTLVGLLNVEHHTFVADLVAAALTKFQQGLSEEPVSGEEGSSDPAARAGAAAAAAGVVASTSSSADVAAAAGGGGQGPVGMHQSRLTLRFIAALVAVNVVEVGALVRLLRQIVKQAVPPDATPSHMEEDDAQEQPNTEDSQRSTLSWQPRADFLVYCVLGCLPWCGSDVHDRDPEGLQALLNDVQEYLGKRKRGLDPLYNVFDMKSVDTGGDAMDAEGQEDEEEDFIEELWGRISVLSQGASSWQVQAVPRTHVAFDTLLSSAINHDLPDLRLPPGAQPPGGYHATPPPQFQARMLALYPPRPRLRVLSAKQTEGDRAPIERFVVEEYVADVLEFWGPSRPECVRALASLPLPQAWSPEYLLAETVFAQLLALPQPPARPLFYAVILADLCRLRTSAGQPLLSKMAPALAATVGALFRRLPLMDLEARNRMTQWLSLHLSNFSFHWPWERWAFAASLPPHASQRVFIQETLHRMVRLSYHGRVEGTVAQALKVLLPPEPCAESRYAGALAGQQAAAGGAQNQPGGHELNLAQELMGKIKDKVAVVEIERWMSAALAESDDGGEVCVRVAGTCVLLMCAKSFTHLVTLLDRFQGLLKLVAPDRQRQQILVSTAAEMWVSSPQHLAITVERLMTHRLTENFAILDWVFTTWAALIAGHLSEDKASLAIQRMSLWEILLLTVNKTVARTVDLRTDLATAEAQARQAQRAMQLAEDKAHQAAMRLQEGDGGMEDEEGRSSSSTQQAERAAQAAAAAEAQAVQLAAERDSQVVSKHQAAEAADYHLQELFLYMYRGFIAVLSEHVEEADQEQEDDDVQAEEEKEEERDQRKAKRTEKLRWVAEGIKLLRIFGRMFYTELAPSVEMIHHEVLEMNVHKKIQNAVFEGIRLV